MTLPPGTARSLAGLALLILTCVVQVPLSAKPLNNPNGLNPADQGALPQFSNPDRESPRMFQHTKHAGRIADWRLHHADGANRVPNDAQNRTLRAYDEFVKNGAR